MLLVAKVRAGGERYYLEATPGWQRRGVEEPGQWGGSGATVLRLEGPVGDEDLARVMAGVHPATADGLGGRRSRVTVAGYDLTFAAPKSVSILAGLGDDDVAEAVRRGHARAVAEAIGYVERRAAAVRRRVEDLPPVPVPAATVSATFVHRTSRALDPHLHSHVVVANLARGPEGGWSALDGRGLYAHRAAVDALYHAQLRHELGRVLGVRWGPLRGGRADIEGISEQARAAFSSRSQQIAADLEHFSATAAAGGTVPASRRANEVAAAVTRAERRLDLDADGLRPEWRRRGGEVGLSPRGLEAVMGRAVVRPGADPPGLGPGDEGRLVDVLTAAPATTQSFARRHVVRAVASDLGPGAPVASVERWADRFLALVDDGRQKDAGLERGGEVGVAEGRRRWPERMQHRDIDELLLRRGMSPHMETGLGRGHQHDGMELGWR